MADAPLLSIRGATKRFGFVQALDRVDLDLHASEVVGLVGDNGAGKSTLVKAISGTHPLDEGEFFVDGSRVLVSSPQAATAIGVATVYQDLALCDNLDVVGNLFLGQELRRTGSGALTRTLDDATMRHRCGELLATLAVSIQDPRVKLEALSGGQRQQVAVARALLGEPRIVLLDEPTAALGVAQTAQVLALIKRLRETGLGVLVISHNLGDLFEVADRVCVLRLGRNAGTFTIAYASREAIVAAITGAEFGGSTARATSGSQ
jgi:D-xylose transport system ATP-binding protein